jgi:hypothetical protein
MCMFGMLQLCLVSTHWWIMQSKICRYLLWENICCVLTEDLFSFNSCWYCFDNIIHVTLWQCKYFTEPYWKCCNSAVCVVCLIHIHIYLFSIPAIHQSGYGTCHSPYGSFSTIINVAVITDCNNLLGTVTYAVFCKVFSGLLSCRLVVYHQFRRTYCLCLPFCA